MADHFSVKEIFEHCDRYWPETSTLGHRYVLNLYRLATRESERTDQWVRPTGLSLSEFDLLATLRRTPPPHVLIPTELQRATLLSSGGLTKLLHQLEAKQLISRSACAEDKRSKHVHLTAKGKSLIESAMATLLQQRHQAMQNAGLSDAEFQQFVALLEKLLSPLEKQDHPQPTGHQTT